MPIDDNILNLAKESSLMSVYEDSLKDPIDDIAANRVEIIVLKYKSPEIEIDCISRIINYTRHPYKLNVFDNRENGRNTAKIWNKLIKESTCDYVLLMDSDAFVQKTSWGNCWLAEMIKAYDILDNVAMVGPVSGGRSVSTMQDISPIDKDPFLIDDHISGYCFLSHKSLYNKVGWFDEDYCFYGQESNLIEKILERGDMHMAIAPRSYVIHGTTGGSESAKTATNQKEFDRNLDANYSRMLSAYKYNKRKNG